MRASQAKGPRHDRSAWSWAVGRAGTYPQARRSHDTRHPVDRAGRTGGLEFFGQARAAVGAGVVVRVDGLHAHQQPLVGRAARCHRAGTGGVVAATRHPEGVAEFFGWSRTLLWP